jgi:hypothetical protein
VVVLNSKSWWVRTCCEIVALTFPCFWSCDSGMLVCDTTWSCTYLVTFRRSLLLSSSVSQLLSLRVRFAYLGKVEISWFTFLRLSLAHFYLEYGDSSFIWNDDYHLQDTQHYNPRHYSLTLTVIRTSNTLSLSNMAVQIGCSYLI